MRLTKGDRLSGGFNIWLWFAIGILIVAIEWPVQSKAKPSLLVNWIACYLNFETSLRPMAGCLLENIIVFSPCPHVSVRGSSSNLLQLVDREFESVAMHCGARTNHASPRFSVVRKIEVIWHRPSILSDPYIDCADHAPRGGLAAIFPNRKESPFGDSFGSLIGSPKRFDILNEHISAQLALSVIFCVPYQIPSRPVQREGGEKKKEREYHNKRVGDFKSSSSYRPELGSLISSLLGLIMAFVFGCRARYLLPYSSFVGVVCLLIGVVLSFQSTIGLLFGFDAWSLLRWLR